MGVTALSLSPFFAARVRRAVRDLTIPQAQSLAKAAIGKRNAREVRRLLASETAASSVTADLANA
jgi:phosphoenolpyruvate-protein kinase (PTS system EI component)